MAQYFTSHYRENHKLDIEDVEILEALRGRDYPTDAYPSDGLVLHLNIYRISDTVFCLDSEVGDKFLEEMQVDDLKDLTGRSVRGLSQIGSSVGVETI